MKIILIGYSATSRKDIPLTSLATYREFICGLVKGCSVIVGRYTFQQPGFYELLKDICSNITVLSTTLKSSGTGEIQISQRFDIALANASEASEDICVIGGERIFNEVIDRACKVCYLTLDHNECTTPIKKHGFLLASHSPNIEAWPENHNENKPSRIGEYKPKIREAPTVKLNIQCWLPNIRKPQ